ncbi:hypothetical protein [Natronohydrobacter thiooxidans]|jgi:hypothetical protein|uniref:hypothetical protein n=1 Tax=Natronohydrobacter thiooxidans TaxID=87172 RepID=UPI0008FF1081|nr:hypothetical protein [Natronohydrobacter thiooxidans]
MKPDSGWISARYQIAWLLGLIVSIAIVVQLERLDLGISLDGPEDSSTIDGLRTRVPDIQAASAEELAAVMLALSAAGLQDPDPSLTAEAAALLDAIPPHLAADPLLIEAGAIMQRVFGL